MKVLLTGGGGFIDAHIVDLLIHEGGRGYDSGQFVYRCVV